MQIRQMWHHSGSARLRLRYKWVAAFWLCIIGILSGCGGSDPSASRWVFKHDGSAQCDNTFDRDLSVNKQRSDLVSAGIDVLRSSCGEITSLEIAEMCGAPTLRIIVFEIAVANLQDAAELGFNNTDNITYRDASCGTSLIPLF